MPSAQSASLVIPDETKKKFPDLIKLILASESMNDEERQYWVNILPVMTPDQISSLRDILETEKKQLAEIDKKYSKEIETVGKDKLVKKTDEERRKRREKRLNKEQAEQSKEMEKAEKLLEDI
ncbi:MAG: hypothetical protein QF755_01455 [Candidatus Peribacteraceae bacterium]|jgi:hypothetical protein|nr:hypothetical protein [Candidatus Peribacteraceae bacterium]HCI03481.1 hypothetical protein [Candidatus Peribacteria bacterium]|tara:strand:+ start:26672 stop:27040 length:369 start_codon:yes stop_codon:yes gene_type:complete